MEKTSSSGPFPVALSEAMIQTLIDGLPVAAFFRLDDRVLMNTCGEAMTGYGRNEITRWSQVFDVLFAHRREEFLAAYEAHRAEGFANPCIDRVRHRNGREIWVDFAGSRFYNGEIFLLYDITNHVATSEALKKSEERWQFGLEGVGDGLWDWDMLSNKVYFSKRWKSMLGYREDEVQNDFSEWESRVHPEDKAVAYREIERHVSGETKVYSVEHRLLAKDGQYRWVLARGNVIAWTSEGKPARMVGTHTDISDRKAAEAALRESEQRWQFALEGSGDGIWDWDAKTNKVFYSPRWKEMLGFEQHEIGDSLDEWKSRVHPDDLAVAMAAINDHLQGRTDIYTSEHRLQCKDGSYRWILDRGKVMSRDAAGKPLRVVGTHTDITPRIMAQRELEEKSRQLEAARAAAEAANLAKSAFLANMSHEIRTPMTAILGFTELLRETGVNALSHHARLDALETIEKNGRHLLGLIADILDISKIEAGKMEVHPAPCEPHAIIGDVAAIIRPRAEQKGLRLVARCLPNLPQSAVTDQMRVRQILMNLLTNAVKFTESGRVELIAGAMDKDHQRYLSFDIIDTGIGMRPDQIEKLFQPFTQVDGSMTRRHGGTGLGLSISKRMAQLLGGDIRVVSEFGRGTRFTVTVLGNAPLGEEATTIAAATPGATLRAKPLEGMRILLAEDTADTAKLLEVVLKSAGAELLTVENGQLAVDAALNARASGEPFDLVLMDMQMPLKDGYQATQELRASNYMGPVVALTAHAMGAERDKCLAAGCSGYISKPVDRKTLVAACERYATTALLNDR